MVFACWIRCYQSCILHRSDTIVLEDAKSLSRGLCWKKSPSQYFLVMYRRLVELMLLRYFVPSKVLHKLHRWQLKDVMRNKLAKSTNICPLRGLVLTKHYNSCIIDRSRAAGCLLRLTPKQYFNERSLVIVLYVMKKKNNS